VLKKLRLKFIGINMAIAGLMLCIIFGLIYHFTKSNIEEQSISMMQDIATGHYSLILPESSRGDVRLPYFTLELDLRGNLIAKSGGYYDLSDIDFLMELAALTLSSGEEIGVIEEYNLRYFLVGTPLSWRIVFADISSEQATLKSLIESCIGIGFLALCLFFAVSLLLAHWAVKPVDKAWREQKQFVADASHELKTPLTVIMTNAEMLADESFQPEEKTRFAESTLTMSRKMRVLVERLLDLARADDGRMKTAFSPLDFSRLTAESILPFEPVFYEKELELEAKVEQGIHVEGSAAYLRQVIDILLDNAQKYSLVPGSVEISLKKHDKGRCLLTVSNPAEQMSAQELKDIFKRFYRADKSRHQRDSYGLGLAIAESIAKEHRGKIWAEYTGGRMSINLLLPCCK